VRADESLLGRSLWAIVLTITTVVVVLSFARQPLFGSDGSASAFGQSLTLWIAGGDAGERVSTVAEQAASCWDAKGRAATVGVLPGTSAAAVAGFFERVRGRPDELLLITSTTLGDIARDRSDALLPEESREQAQRAAGLLASAAPVAVLASDPLALAVRADSPIHTTAELLALMRRWPARPLFDIASNTWLQGNLAELVQSAGLRGEVPYGVFKSSKEALASLDAGEAQVALASRSAIREAVRGDRLRELPWPASGAAAPRAWLAILAPAGLAPGKLASLRAQARGLCAGAVWTRLLRHDGLAPVAPSTVHLGTFVRQGMAEAMRMQALAGQIMRDYK
jgi:hypothetical protein